MEATVSSSHLAEQSKIDYVSIKNASMILRAVDHKLRQQIIRLLDENKRMGVTDIYVKLSLGQSVASQQLAILRDASIVCAERRGKEIFYSLNLARLEQVAIFMEKLNAE